MLEARFSSTDGAVDTLAPVRSTPFPVAEPPVPAPGPDPLATVEEELAAFLGGTPRAIVCDGHQRALEYALRLALQGHDPAEVEVVTPALGAAEAARITLRLGAGVVPADVEQDTGNLAARALAAAVGPRTRAVIVAHLFGHPATMPELLRLAEHHGLAVVEDISEALGAAHSGRPVGAMGTIAALGGGEGHVLTSEGVGALLVPTAEAEALVRGWRDTDASVPRETAIRLALAELRGAEEALHTRRQAAWHLTYELRSIRGVSPMFHGRRVRHAYDRYVVRLRSVLWNRSVEETAAALTLEGIPASVAIGPLLQEDPDVRARLGDDDPRLEPARFAIATQLAAELIAIPLNAAVTSGDMNDVAEAIRRVAATGERGVPKLAS